MLCRDGEGSCSVLRMAPPGADHGLDPTRHGLDQVRDDLLGDLEPLRVDALPQFLDARRRLRTLGQLPLQKLPQMFNWIKIRRLGRPFQQSQTKLAEALLGLLRGVFGIIILLKDYLFFLEFLLLQGVEEFAAQDLRIQLRVHRPVDSAKASDSLHRHAPP